MADRLEDKFECEETISKGRTVTRRDFLKMAGIAGAAIGVGGSLGGLVAACGGEEETTTTTAAGGETTTTAAGGETTTTAASGEEMGREIKIGWVTMTTGVFAGLSEPDTFLLNQAKATIGDGMVCADGKKHPIAWVVKDSQSDSNRAAEVAGQLGRALMPSEPTPPDQPVEGLPGLKGLAEVADGVGEGQVMPVMLYEAGSVLALVEKRIPASHRPLAEVEEEVRQAVLAAKAATAAREDAARLLAELKTAADPAAALKASPGAKETEWLPRDGQVPGLDPSAALVSALFARPAGQPLAAQPVAAGAGFAACALLERKEPAPEELAAKKKE